MVDRDELRKLAEAATPGPWMVDYQSSYPTGEMVVTENSGEIAFAQKRTAAYIAAVSPEVVLALLDRLERLDRDCYTCANKSTDGIYSEDCLMCRHYFGDAYEPRPEKNKCALSQD